MRKKPARKLCAQCHRAANDPIFRFPTHLVHPEHGKAMVFDIYGKAVCPDCGTLWCRTRDNAVTIVEKPEK